MKFKFKSMMVLVCLMTTSVAALAGSKWVRLGWQGDAATEATVSFTASGSNNNPYVAYGYSTNEGSWLSESLTFTSSMASITSKHVRLSGLNSDSAVYFRVCDDNGCGQRFWFRTAPTDNSSFTLVAGGDTRSGWTNRQNGNRLVAKIRPLFVMHGGDFTDSNNNSQWSQWLDDWELSYSNDNIDGYSYKRIYPLVSTHGNHEDNDISTICKMFGVDANRNNSCSAYDTYYDVNVSPLLSVYTLNSQFQNQSSTLRNAQNNWLSSELSSNGSNHTWRFAQYHKPMFPHYSGKSDNQTLFNWWAQEFYDHAMNVVVESDTHMTKLTDVVIPNGSNFTTAAAGTVYVGEGSWGAPARSANDPKSYTIDLASIQQFKVITVTPDRLDVRTAQFNSSAATLSKAARDADPIALPNNVNWWSANGVGEVLALEQDAAQRSIRAGSGGGGNPGNGTTVSLSASDDTFISSNNSNSNYDGSSEQLLADGTDSTYGEMHALIKWDASAIPSCATVESAKIELNIFNPSSGTYSVYAGVNSWNEGSATWNSVGGYDQQGDQVGSFNPSSTGIRSVQLNAGGVADVQSWVNGGSNRGVVIASAGTTDGIDFYDRENGAAPALVVTFNEDNCGGGSNQNPLADFTSSKNNLSVSFSDQSSDSDGSVTAWSWNFGDGNSSNAENPNHTYASAGTYNVSLTVTDNDGATDSTSQQVTVTAASGWSQLVYEDFENGWGAFVDGGSDARLTSSYAIGSTAMKLQDNSSSSEARLGNSLNLTSYNQLKIEFSYVARDFEGSEDFWVRYSANGGSSWKTVKAYVNNVDFVDDGTRYAASITIDSGSYSFSNNALIKFECDASSNNDDVYFDNISISAQ